jgi:hypothetical protein
MNYCESLISDAQKNNQNVYFILPPTTIGYRKALPAKEEVFKSIISLAKKYDNAKNICISFLKPQGIFLKHIL